MTKLYEWQEKCLERWIGNHGRGMVQAATGAGKTLLALEAVKYLEEKTEGEILVRIVVPNAGLMRQWEKALRGFLEESSGEEGRLQKYLAGNQDKEKEPTGFSEGSQKEEKEPTGFSEGQSGGSGMREGIRSQIGLRGGGQKSSFHCKYMIYVINSARYELARQLLTELRNGKKVFLIADECHHYGSAQNRLIFEFLPYISEYEKNFFSMGLSATLPAGEEKRYLESVLGRKIYNYGIAEAAANQTVCRYDIYHISVDFRKEERDEYEELSESMMQLYSKLLQVCPSLRGLNQRERFEMLGRLSADKNRRISKMASGYMMLTYKRKNLVCLAADRTACACELVERLDGREKIIIFGERIRQADELYRLLVKKYPGRVGRYHSQMGRRANKNALDGFGRGELRILISCKAIDEGVNVPDASVGIILSGTGVQRQRIQRLGRIVRNMEGKEGASLYYLHMKETSEDTCYLPNAEESSIFELAYRQKERGFQNEPYDEAAEELMRRMRSKGADEKIMEELKRCLRLGSVRSDWKREREWLEKKAEQSGSVREKNYWMCMKWLREIEIIIQAEEY